MIPSARSAVFILIALMSQTASAALGEPAIAKKAARATLVVEDSKIISKTTSLGKNKYYYRDGRLAMILYADKRIAQYTYKDGKLERVYFSDGTFHTPIYNDNELVSIKSSTGKRLMFTNGKVSIDNASFNVSDKSERFVKAEGPTVSVSETVSKEHSIAATNKAIIDNDMWETQGWNCYESPTTGEPICESGPPDDDGPGGGGGGGGGDVPPFNDPGEGGGGGGWGGGGDPGGSGGGPSQEPPGSAPNESPLRAACMAAAYRGWVTMDAGCMQLKRWNMREGLKCDAANWVTYNEFRADCVATTPP